MPWASSSSTLTPENAGTKEEQPSDVPSASAGRTRPAPLPVTKPVETAKLDKRACRQTREPRRRYTGQVPPSAALVEATGLPHGTLPPTPAPRSDPMHLGAKRANKRWEAGFA